MAKIIIAAIIGLILGYMAYSITEMNTVPIPEFTDEEIEWIMIQEEL